MMGTGMEVIEETLDELVSQANIVISDVKCLNNLPDEIITLMTTMIVIGKPPEDIVVRVKNNGYQISQSAVEWYSIELLARTDVYVRESGGLMIQTDVSQKMIKFLKEEGLKYNIKGNPEELTIFLRISSQEEAESGQVRGEA